MIVLVEELRSSRIMEAVHANKKPVDFKKDWAECSKKATQTIDLTIDAMMKKGWTITFPEHVRVEI